MITTLYKLVTNNWKIIVPEIISELMPEIHVIYGHIGKNKLFKMIGQQFCIKNVSYRIL